MRQAVIAATGLYTPPHSVSNAELVEAFNAYVELLTTPSTPRRSPPARRPR